MEGKVKKIKEKKVSPKVKKVLKKVFNLKVILILLIIAIAFSISEIPTSPESTQTVSTPAFTPEAISVYNLSPIRMLSSLQLFVC